MASENCTVDCTVLRTYPRKEPSVFNWNHLFRQFLMYSPFLKKKKKEKERKVERKKGRIFTIILEQASGGCRCIANGVGRWRKDRRRYANEWRRKQHFGCGKISFSRTYFCTSVDREVLFSFSFCTLKCAGSCLLVTRLHRAHQGMVMCRGTLPVGSDGAEVVSI